MKNYRMKDMNIEKNTETNEWFGSIDGEVVLKAKTRKAAVEEARCWIRKMNEQVENKNEKEISGEAPEGWDEENDKYLRECLKKINIKNVLYIMEIGRPHQKIHRYVAVLNGGGLVEHPEWNNFKRMVRAACE